MYNAVMASGGVLVNNDEYIAYRDEEYDEVRVQQYTLKGKVFTINADQFLATIRSS